MVEVPQRVDYQPAWLFGYPHEGYREQVSARVDDCLEDNFLADAVEPNLLVDVADRIFFLESSPAGHPANRLEVLVDKGDAAPDLEVEDWFLDKVCSFDLVEEGCSLGEVDTDGGLVEPVDLVVPEDEVRHSDP